VRYHLRDDEVGATIAPRREKPRHRRVLVVNGGGEPAAGKEDDAMMVPVTVYTNVG
jgi:hypothetical protein